MSGFRLVEVSLSGDLEPVQLSEKENGVAIIARKDDRAVGFALHDRAPGSVIPAHELGRLAAEASAEGVVADALSEDLTRRLPELPAERLTVAVCTRNRARLLERCLESINAARSTPGGELVGEVVVVDNAPSDSTTRRVVDRAGVRYVTEAVPGLDFARNAAWRAASGDFVAFIDDDAVLDRSWVAGCGGALRLHPDVGAITGLVLPLALDSEAQVLFEKGGGFRRGFVPRRWQGAEHSNDRLYPFGAGIFGAGCNMVIRRSLLEKLNGFDEALDTGATLPGGGDLDIFYRVLRSGAPLVYEPSMTVFHEHRLTLDGLHQQYYSWGLGFLAFLGKIWQTEPAARRQVALMAAWWAKWMLGRVARATVQSNPPLPVSMIASELAGGVEGVFGEYRRSLSRVRVLTQGRR